MTDRVRKGDVSARTWATRTSLKGGDREDPGGHDCSWETLRDPNRSGCRVESGVKRRERWMTGLGVLPGEQWFWGEEPSLAACLLVGGDTVLRPTFSLCKPRRLISGPRSPAGHVQTPISSHGPTSRLHWGSTPAPSRVGQGNLAGAFLLPCWCRRLSLPRVDPRGPGASQALRAGDLSPHGLDAAPSCWSRRPQEPSSLSGSSPQGPLGEGGLCRAVCCEFPKPHSLYPSHRAPRK